MLNLENLRQSTCTKSEDTLVTSKMENLETPTERCSTITGVQRKAVLQYRNFKRMDNFLKKPARVFSCSKVAVYRSFSKKPSCASVFCC